MRLPASLAFGNMSRYLAGFSTSRATLFRIVRGRAAAREDTEANIVARTSPGEFVRQVQAETKKVVWPTGRETMQTTLMVVLMAVLLAAFFFALDSAFSGIVQFLLGFVTK
jgi:preprotein translocase subunit SecE